MNDDPLYAAAQRLDRDDVLSGFRDQFLLPPDILYFDGNSLGPSPRITHSKLARLVEDEWGLRLIRSWNENWLDLCERVSSKIATLIGADPDEVVISDSTSVNFYKLAHAAQALQRNREGVISEVMGFPTNNYILEKVYSASAFSWVACPDGVSMPEDDVKSLMTHHVGLMSLNHVNYRSGWLHNMGALNRAAHEKGILNLWDLSHSVGAVPIDVHGADTDLAVGCTYKYLNGGPGAPSFLYVRRDLQKQLGNPIQGWFGHAGFFNFSDNYEPAEDVRRFLTGTPPILSISAIESGLDVTLNAGIEKIRAKSVAMGEFFLENWHSKRRGSHVSLGHDQAFAIDTALIKRMGVIPDFRKPDNIRFGLAPLYNTYAEIYEALERIRLMLTDESYQVFDILPGSVT
jgi:kynureninase